jgi:hypothetical protein
MNNRGRLEIGRLLRACVGMALLACGALALQHGPPYSRSFLESLLARDQAEAEPVISDGPAEDFNYVFSRLSYRGPGGRLFQGHTWDTDYPKADRQFLIGVLRYTRVHGRRQEQVLRLEDPKLFGFPFLYAVEVGYLDFSEQEAVRMREYLERGGFLVVDDFHGTREWQNFERQMKKVFPNRAIQEVDLSDPIFHCFFDITEKKPVPGLQYLFTGRIFEQDGTQEHYRAIYDDYGRIMVMINYNVDLGDAWEWADLPQYPEEWTSYAYRLGVNYIVYSMTH